MNPSISCGSSFDDDFWVGSDSVFGVDFRGNMDCGLGRIQASVVEKSSWSFLSLQRLSFLFWFQSQQGILLLTNPGISSWCSLIDYFWVISYSIFGEDYRVNKDCARRRIQASAGETVSMMIFESAVTLFSVSISESTWTVCADESKLHCGGSLVDHF